MLSNQNFSLICAIASVQSTARIEELLQEDQNVKRKRERFQRQSSLLSKLTRQLSIHDNRAAAASWSDGGTGTGKLILKFFIFVIGVAHRDRLSYLVYMMFAMQKKKKKRGKITFLYRSNCSLGVCNIVGATPCVQDFQNNV